MIKVLGAYGGKLDGFGTTSFQVRQNLLIDAGSVFKHLLEPPEKIDFIFLTHSHLDHLADIPFLIDAVFTRRREPLRIFAGKQTIVSIKKFIMNNHIWPDFAELKLPTSGRASIEYIQIEPFKSFKMEKLEIMPFPSNHVVETFGFIIRIGGKKVIFSGDTASNPLLWEMASSSDVYRVIVDVSFPNRLSSIAVASGHYTPLSLLRDIERYEISDEKILVYHIKPYYLREISQEISELLPNAKILRDGDLIGR